MIYTVTLNPSLDYVMQAGELVLGRTNRSHGEEIYVGGKGINVSVILHRLSQPTTVLGLVGGFTGQVIASGVESMGIPSVLIPLAEGFSRINVKLKGQNETEINGKGPAVSSEEFGQLLAILDTLTAEDILVLSGSVPSGLSYRCYTDMMAAANQKGARVVVDTAGENLKQSLPYKPFLIKPNGQELEELSGKSIDETNMHQIAQAAEELQRMGAVNVLVSLGKNGSLLLDETGTIQVMPAAKGQAINTVGAGDSMIAGFISGYKQTHDYAHALRLGTACGGATAFSNDLADKSTIERVLATLDNPKTL